MELRFVIEKTNFSELKWRSPPPNPPKPPPKIVRELTESEQDYLKFFTEFCSDKDDPSKYGIDINQPPAKTKEKVNEEEEEGEEEEEDTEIGDENTEIEN